MTSTLVQPVTVHRTKPVGVPIQKSPAPPSFEPPLFIDGDGDDDDNNDPSGLSFLEALRMLVMASVLCIASLFLLVRRSIMPDWLWCNRIQDVSARMGYHQPLV